MRLLLLGATGLVGSTALKLALADSAISQVIALHGDLLHQMTGWRTRSRRVSKNLPQNWDVLVSTR
jgi:hypothetical protein